MDKFLLSVTPEDRIHGVANSLKESLTGVRIDANYAKKLVGLSLPLMWNHDWNSLPVGSVTMQSVSDDGLEFDGMLFNTAADHDKYVEAIKNHAMSVSVGFANGTKNAEGAMQDFTLIELSLTPTPADTHASITFQSMGKTTQAAQAPGNTPADPATATKNDNNTGKSTTSTGSKDSGKSNNNVADFSEVVAALNSIASALSDINDNLSSDGEDNPDPANEDGNKDSGATVTQAMTDFQNGIVDLITKKHKNLGEIYAFARDYKIK
jgi:hypothetical protein